MDLELFLAVGNDSALWVLCGLAVVLIIYVVIRPFRKKKDPLESLPRMGLAQQRSVEREMNNVLVELSEMARQVSAQLDTRSARLEALIDEADRRIAELTRLADGAAPAAPDAPREAAIPAGRAEDARYSEIYALSDRGENPQEIARKLDRPRGEVELILALRR